MRSRVARLAGITCETAFDCRLAQETESSFNCLDRSRLRGDGTVRTCRQRRAGRLVVSGSAIAVHLHARRLCANREVGRVKLAVTEDPDDGLQAVFLANRQPLLRFLVARGAGDDAEDILQEVWLKIARRPAGPVGAPMAYLYRAANMAMIDRYRSARQSAVREKEWTEASSGPVPGISDSPSAERVIAGRQFARKVEDALAEFPDRAVKIFRRSRIDGIAQRAIAEEFGVSISTVEGDLRAIYRVLAELRERLDEE